MRRDEVEVKIENSSGSEKNYWNLREEGKNGYSYPQRHHRNKNGTRGNQGNELEINLDMNEKRNLTENQKRSILEILIDEKDLDSINQKGDIEDNSFNSHSLDNKSYSALPSKSKSTSSSSLTEKSHVSTSLNGGKSLKDNGDDNDSFKSSKFFDRSIPLLGFLGFLIALISIILFLGLGSCSL